MTSIATPSRDLAIGGGLLAASLGGIFLSVAIGMAAFGLIALPNLLFKVGFIHSVPRKTS
ncbi:hypothetical protein [Sphingomonas sp. R86520]|uniref:hypothetical protein n=1 Tax=Sphingomonas sp. R86520 TaxID=3093859 RepID=UPI0036D3121F